MSNVEQDIENLIKSIMIHPVKSSSFETMLNNIQKMESLSHTVQCQLKNANLLELLRKPCTHYLVQILNFIQYENENDFSELVDRITLLLSNLSVVGGNSSIIKEWNFNAGLLKLRELSFSEASFGWQTWGAANIFCKLLDKHVMDLDNHTVLEIGCGTGLGGIYSCKSTQLTHIYLTDYLPAIIDNAKKNAELNELDSNRYTAAHLDWKNPKAFTLTNGDKFKRIIAMDVCYEVESTQLAVETIDYWLHSEGIVYVVLPLREKFEKETATFLKGMHELGFVIKQRIKMLEPSLDDTPDQEYEYFEYCRVNES